MTPPIEVPSYLEGTALGILVAVAIVVIWIALRSLGGRAKTEASLNTMLTATIDQLRTALESERAYSMRLLDLLADKERQFGELTRNLVISHGADMDRLRGEHLEAMRRVNQRVDDAEREHEQCRRDLGDLRRRMDTLEPGVATA